MIHELRTYIISITIRNVICIFSISILERLPHKNMEMRLWSLSMLVYNVHHIKLSVNIAHNFQADKCWLYVLITCIVAPKLQLIEGAMMETSSHLGLELLHASLVTSGIQNGLISKLYTAALLFGATWGTLQFHQNQDVGLRRGMNDSLRHIESHLGSSTRPVSAQVEAIQKGLALQPLGNPTLRVCINCWGLSIWWVLTLYQPHMLR